MRMRAALAAALPVAAMTVILAPGLCARQHHPEAVKRKPPKHAVTRHQRPKTVSRKAPKHANTAEAAASQSYASHKADVAPKRKVRRRVSRHRVRMPAGPSSERIQQIQQALARWGYFQGDPTGKWDAETIDAMKQFQQAEGIPANGKIDATSLQELGLGSDVAGLGAPRPVLHADTTGGDNKR